MGQKNRKYGCIILVAVVAGLIFIAENSIAADLAKVLKKAKAKYARFDKDIRDMSIVQTMMMITPHGEMTSDMKTLRKGKKIRTEITTRAPQTSGMPPGMGGMKNIIIHDGKDTWMISSFLGKKKLSREEEEQYQTGQQWWNYISENAKIVGSEKVGKKDCYIVQIKEQPDSHFNKMWLDKKGLNLVKSESRGPDGQTVLMLNSDFNKIKGDWEIPYKTEMYMNGNLMSRTLVKSLKVNSGLENSLFDPEQEKVKGGGSMMDMMKKMMEKQ